MTIKDMPIGAKVKEEKSGLVFLVADHNHMGYHGTTLVTDEAVLFGCVDAAEPTNPDGDIAMAGNSFYPLSNINQWLNSEENDWYKPTHEHDAPPVTENMDMGRQDLYEVEFISPDANFAGDFPYKDEPGFLSWFSKEFVNSLNVSKVACYIKPDTSKPHYGPPDPTYINVKAFLMSAPEMGYDRFQNGTEGTRFRLFNEPRMRMCAPTAKAIHRPEGYRYYDSSFDYFLRTPAPGSVCQTYSFNGEHKAGDPNSGALSATYSKAISGIRPAMNIDNSVKVSEKPDDDGVYTLVY